MDVGPNPPVPVKLGKEYAVVFVESVGDCGVEESEL
jgi:hypothetical protein